MDDLLISGPSPLAPYGIPDSGTEEGFVRTINRVPCQWLSDGAPTNFGYVPLGNSRGKGNP
jgi:hypothetical protein